MIEKEFASIETMPMHDRRYIRVISDRAFYQKSQEIEKQVRAEGHGSGSSFSNALLIAAPLIPGGALIRGAMLIAGIAYTAYATGPVKGAISNEDPGLIIEVPVKDTKNFSFPAGIAEIGQVYAANPLSDRSYFYIESYNDDMIIHKLSELELILNALGAKKYSIIYHETSESLVSANAKAGAKQAAIETDASINNARKMKFERRGTSRGGDPILPSPLTWYHREPVWQSLAESRMKYGREEFAFSVELEKSLKLSAQATVNAQVLSGALGSTFERLGNVILSVEGNF